MLLFIFFFLQILPNENSKTVFIKESISSSQIKISEKSVVYVSDNVTLTIDSALTLTNCEVVLGANAKIIIEGGNTLNILGSYLHGCNEMWDGIYITFGGAIETDNSTIEDATNGIVAYFGSSLHAQNTDFNRNLRSIRFFMYYPDEDDYNITNCTFGMGNHTQMLGGSYTRPLTGIDIRYSGELSIPNPEFGGNQPNTFSDMNCGIDILSSKVNVFENFFSDISNYENFTGAEAGSAIRASGASAWYPFLYNPLVVKTDVNTPDGNSTVHFQDCETGIYANKIALNAENNKMNNVAHGINTLNSLHRVIASNNRIEQTNFGITLNNSAGASSNISDNFIEVNDPTSQFVSNNGLFGITHINTYGISQSEINSAAPVTSTIWQNEISGGRNCISLTNANGTQVLENTLLQNSNTAVAGAQAGIFALNSRNLLVEGNAITGNGTAYCDGLGGVFCNVNSAYRKSGLSFSNSGGEICSNEFDNIGYGNLFAANCVDAVVQLNTYGDSKFAIALRGAGIMQVLNSQGNVNRSHENEFTGTYDNDFTPNFAANLRTMSFINVAQNGAYTPPTFYYNLNNITDETTDPSESSPIPDLGIISDEADNITQSATCQLPQLPFPTWFYLQVAGGVSWKLMQEGFEQTGPRLTEMHLLRRLKENPELMNEDEAFEDFYDAKMEQDFGKISSYEDKLLLLCDSTTIADSAAYAAQLADAQYYQQQLPDTGNMAYNYKRANGIFLNLLQQQPDTALFGSEDKAFIENLSVQCPYMAGEGVFIARALLAMYEPGYFFDDTELCDSIQVSYKTDEWDAEQLPADVDTAQFDYLIVYPNPTTQKLIVGYYLKQDAVLYFTDQLGRQVLIKNLPAKLNTATLDLSGYASGIYNYRVVDVSGKNISSGKVSLAR